MGPVHRQGGGSKFGGFGVGVWGGAEAPPCAALRKRGRGGAVGETGEEVHVFFLWETTHHSRPHPRPLPMSRAAPSALPAGGANARLFE